MGRLIIASCLRADAISAVPALCDQVPDPDSNVRKAAAEALVAIRPCTISVGKLIEGLRHGDVTLPLVTVLGFVEDHVGDATQELIKALSVPECDIRRIAATTLGKIGWRAKPALAMLKKLATDAPDLSVRAAAAAAIDKIIEDIGLNNQKISELQPQPRSYNRCGSAQK